ncbi:MAG: helix-turn-helix transcriptional regulator [Clostridia bacterium]|nr:helix-turn-helix transcriptional regulator [Clostridia bacterium]
MNGLDAVVDAQRYIKLHCNDENFSRESVCTSVGYSRRQLDRLFKKYLQMTLCEYIKSVTLTESAKCLLETNENILEVALKSRFDSHEGFSRSFAKRFGISPEQYRNKQIAIPLFTQYPANHYRNMKEEKVVDNTSICTVTPVFREKRKLIYLPSKSADGYFSFCEEVGCDWEGLLNSVPEKFDTAALLDLPDFLVEEEMSCTACGIEVPLDYDKPLPSGYKKAELDECIMLYFQSEPYDNPDDFGEYIGKVFRAIDNYDFERYGYKTAYNLAPYMNFGAETNIGARVAVPVIRK